MWNPPDTGFFHPRRPVAIAAIGRSDHQLTRLMLEELQAVVLMHLVGTPGDFLRVVAQGEQAPAYLVICAHGDDVGLVFGEYAPHIDTAMLVEGSLPPEVIARHVDLPGAWSATRRAMPAGRRWPRRS